MKGISSLFLGLVFVLGLSIGGLLAANSIERDGRDGVVDGGQILGTLVADRCRGDCLVRLGGSEQTALVARGGFFELDGVAAGCHDLIIEGAGVIPWSIENAVCVESGRSSVVSLISGNPR